MHDIAFGKGSAQAYFHKLVALLGYTLDKKKRQLLGQEVIFLGVRESYGEVSSDGPIIVSPKPDRISRLLDDVQEVLERGSVTESVAISLAGRLQANSECFQGRAVLGQMHIIRSCSGKLSKYQYEAFRFQFAVIQIASFRKIYPIPTQRRRLTCYTDASAETIENVHVVTVSFIVLDSSRGLRKGGFCVLPQELLNSFSARETFIAQGEAVAPLFLVKKHSNDLNETDVLLNVDNMGVVCGLISGSSSVCDFACSVNSFHLAMMAKSASLWVEHVPSVSNVADGGSRVGAACKVAKALKIHLKEMPMITWPEDVRTASAEDWLAHIL